MKNGGFNSVLEGSSAPSGVPVKAQIIVCSGVFPDRHE
jgi:hypothetical protein